jgi:flagellum-specific peptidoglycan hydrolase FlgJ
VDPRFDFVSPKGKAPTWNQMGNGNWATDPNYASTVINLYNRMRSYAGLPPA